jgi:hypothetical protein
MPERSDMQSKPMATDHRSTVLIIGISRGIGRGLTAEYPIGEGRVARVLVTRQAVR